MTLMVTKGRNKMYHVQSFSMRSIPTKPWLNFIILSIFLLTGCVQFREKPVAVEKHVVTEKPPTDNNAKINRQVKDVDYKSKLEEKSPKKRIAVLPFLDLSTERPEAGRVQARLTFMDELNKTDQVIAIDSNQLKIDTSKYFSAGEYDLLKLTEAAQNAGVNSFLEGKVLDLRVKKDSDNAPKKIKTIFEAVVRLRMINVRSGKVVFHTVKTVTIEDASAQVAEGAMSSQFLNKNPELVAILIKDAFLDFTPQVVTAMNEITWEGRIAAFNGDKIYINVGRISGVQVGDILKVVEDGNEIYDPEIGYHLGKVAGRIKGTLEIVSYFGQDGAVSIIHSGAGFKENDRVELYH